MRRAGVARVVGLALCVAVAASCASSDRAGDVSLDALRAVESRPTTTSTTAAATERPRPPCDDAAGTNAQSARPGAAPSPDGTPAAPGSTMAAIQQRGYLIAGVDENTLGLSFRDPGNGQLEGFEIDVLREISRALFGDPDRVVFTTVTTEQKVNVVRDGTVDVTASAVSMVCKRWADVAFSSAYYATPQKVLVRSDSDIATTADLADKKVCGTSGGTNEALIKGVSHRKPFLVEARTDCLVALQEGEVDAILTHETFLKGFAAQDPNMRILPDELSNQLYGLPIAWEHLDFVRYVNALFEQWRGDGTLARLAESSFDRARIGPARPIPPASYWG